MSNKVIIKKSPINLRATLIRASLNKALCHHQLGSKTACLEELHEIDRLVMELRHYMKGGQA